MQLETEARPCGVKDDDGKLRLDLIPPEVILAIGETMTFGARRYGENNWQGVGAHRYEAALLRHLMAWKQGSLRDAESGLPHLWHVLTNAAFMVALEAYSDVMYIPPCCKA